MNEKTALSLTAQIERLSKLGLDVSGEHANVIARLLISRGYFRLSGYWRYFQASPQFGDNTFKSGTTATTIQEIYRFDEQLREILSRGLTALELSFRTQFCNAVSTKYGPFEYLDPTSYVDEIGTDRDGNTINYKDKLIADINRELDRSALTFIEARRSRSQRVHMWEAFEALSFGTTSKIYSLFDDDEIAASIAKVFLTKSDPERLRKTLRAMVNLRNTTAHHGRIWNDVPRSPVEVPRDIRVARDKSIYTNTPWGIMMTLAYMVDQIKIDPTFSSDLNDFTDAHPQYLEGLQYPHKR